MISIIATSSPDLVTPEQAANEIFHPTRIQNKKSSNLLTDQGMRSLYFVATLCGVSLTTAVAQVRPKSDSVMFLSPYVVIGINPGQVQVNGTYSLYVPKGILTEKIRVSVRNSQSWADYVFNDTYPLKPISAVEKFIKENKHLPDVPTADDVVRNGLDLSDNQRILLQKVEEMMLYIIQQEKRIHSLEQRLSTANSGQPKRKR